MFNEVKKVLICFTILMAIFAGDASASPGVSLKGVGFSFGNIRGEGKIVDGLSLTLGNPISLLSIFGKTSFDEINGISIALAPASRVINGISISPVYQHAKGGIKGVALGLIGVGGGDLQGVFIGGLGIASAWKVRGIVLSGGLVRGHKAMGVLVGGISVWVSELKGLALGALVTGGDVRGATIGLIGIVDQLHGLSVGVFNFVRLVNGVQVGLFNYTEQLNGVQIGVINYAGNNPDGLRWLPVINAHF